MVLRPDILYMGIVDSSKREGSLYRVEIYKDSTQGEPFVYAYVNGELDDSVYEADDFIDTYGEDLYPSIEDFKTGKNKTDVRSIWK